MSATFDATTTSEYAAATTAAARSALIVAALTGTISVKVFNGSDTEMGSGTMASPWATASDDTVTVGEVSSFTVGTTGTPDSNWYIRFQNAGVTRWVRGSFGLSGSGQDFTWSLDNWTATHTGTIGTATITTTGNSAPAFTVAPTTAAIASTGGTIQFTAVDPDGGSVVYSLTTTRNGITINASTGLVTVTSAAAGTGGNIVVRASDGILTTSATCAVTVASASGSIKYYPGHYALNGAGDSATTRASLWNEVAASGGWKGGHVRYYWGDLESSLGNYDFSIIDNDLAVLAGNGHKMVIQILMARFGAGAAVGSLVPSYLLGSTYNGGVASISDRVVIQQWNTAVVNRIIALDTALSLRYDGNTGVSGIVVSETAIGNKNEVAAFGYTLSSFVTQIKRRILAAESDWSQTPHFLYYNFLDTTNPTGADLAQYCLAHNCGLGGPDIYPNAPTEGQDVYMGNQGGVDYRGVLPVCYANQGTSVNTYPIADLYTYAKNTLRCGYMNTLLTPDGNPNTRTAIKNYVAANPTMYATVPTIYQ